MDFDFTDEQEQLRDAVRKWVDKGYDFERRRSITKAGGFSREAYGEMAELGLTGLYIPEDDGGMGMGPTEGMVVMEELGRGMALEPLSQTLIAGAVVAGYAPAALKSEWLPKIASGESLVVLAYQERAARYNASKCEAKATSDQQNYTLAATKSIVSGGDRHHGAVSGGAHSRWRDRQRLCHPGRRSRRRSDFQPCAGNTHNA